MKTIAVVSDLHIASTVALCKPSVDLDDGGTYQISKGQRWLWGNWLDFLERVEQAKPDILIFNGDTIEGDLKSRSNQLITRNKTNALKIAADTLDPLCKLAPARYFIRGTAAHIGKSGSIEEDLAKDLGGTRIDKNYSQWELFLDVDGVKIHATHHCSMGTVPWTRKYSATSLAAKISLEYAMNREYAPHLSVRGHMHRWGDSYDAYPTRVLMLPGWTIASEYIHRISPDTLAEIGGAIIRCSAGNLEVEKIEYKPKGRTWVKI